MPDQYNINVSQWIENLEKRGKISFPLNQLEEELPNYSEIAIKSALKRLSKKGKIVSLHKGFYLIISAQYANRGILPPALFMDNFMKYLGRPYYVGLLSAAALYGAAHQQPQEYFVITDFPVLRPSHKKGLKVNFICKRTIESKLLNERKTESGYLKVSSPVLTASDLVQFEKRSGGITRVASVINELVEEMDPKEFNPIFFSSTPSTTIQRLGYIIEKVINNENLANELFEESKKNGIDFFRIPLKASAHTKGFSSGNRWKVIVNAEIEIDE
jgi:predicted transcriptional regulator of viral defense system